MSVGAEPLLELGAAAETLIEPRDTNQGAQLRKLDTANNGVNSVTPAAETGIPHPFTAGSLLWHSRIWKALFGDGGGHHNPTKPTQAEVNQTVAQALGNTLALIGTITDIAASDTQAVLDKLNADVAAIYSNTNSDVQGLAQQIAQVRAGAAANLNAAIDQAVARADAYTVAQLRTTANVLEGRMADIVNNLSREVADRARGDESTLAKSEAFTTSQLRITADVLEGRMANLAATEQSDVLNLNRRITSVNTTLEGDISKAINTAEGFATGLVTGLNVPGLRTEVNGLAGQVSQLATQTDECLEPLCDTVTPNASQLGKLGNLLKQLEGTAPLLALFGFVAWAATDPTDAAQVTDDTLGTVVDGLADAAKGLAGLV